MKCSKPEPYEESGPVTMCVNCYEALQWIKKSGWTHSVKKIKD